MKNLSKYALIICMLSIIASAAYYPKWKIRGTEATLSWDVAGYYYYLPAFFIYKDAKKLKFRDNIVKKYQPSDSFYQAFKDEKSGNFVMKYSIGQAVMMAPSFFIGHFVALLSDYPADGFSRPYQAAIHWGSLLIACLGLFYSRKNLLEFFEDKVVALTLIFVTIGTNYLAYAAHNSAMTHNYLFTLYAILIWNTIQWHKKPNFQNASMLGLCIGLAALTRPTEIIALLLPVLWGVSLNKESIINRFSLLKKYWNHIAVAAAITALIGSIQVMYWLYVTGQPLVYSYEDQEFDWLTPHLYEVLLSYKKGWLLYTPIMTFGVLGLYALWKQKRALFLSVFLFSIVNYYIVSAWGIWWYGGSFGQRAMVQSYAVWMFPFAAFTHWILQKNWRQGVLFPIFIFCMALNIFHTCGPIDPEMMNKAFYWKTFFNFDVKDKDYLLLDSNERLFEERNNVKRVYENSLDTFSLDTKGVVLGEKDSTNRHLYVDDKTTFSPALFIDKTAIGESEWLRLGADFFMPVKEYFFWTMPQLIVVFEKEGQVVKYVFIRPSRALKDGQWSEIWIDCKIPNEDFDRVKTYIWNVESATKSMYMDNLYLETFSE